MIIDLREIHDIFDVTRYSNPVIDTRKIYFDSRFPMQDGIFFPIAGENFDGEDFISIEEKTEKQQFFSRQDFPEKDYIKILISNNEALRKLAEYVCSKFEGITIGITGTSGKTTLKEILSTILSSKFKVHYSKGNFNNLIGLPMSILLLDGNEEFGIFELGTNQPGEIKLLSQILKPDVSFITSIGRGHTEFLVDEEGVFLEKRDIITETKCAFFTTGCGHYGERMMDFSRNYDIKAINLENRPEITGIDLERGTEIVFVDDEKSKFHIRTLLFGNGNITNFYLAVCACNTMKWLDVEEIKEASKNVKGESNRLFPKKTENGLYYIDDSYNSNPLSLKNGILFLCQLNIPAKYAVIGDMMEINDHDIQFSAGEIIDILMKNKNNNPELIFYGENIKHIYTKLKECNINNISFYRKDSEMELVEKLKTELDSKSGDKVVYFKASRGARIEKVMEALNSALHTI